MEGASPKSTSVGKGSCPDCAGKMRKLSTENLKLRQKLEEVAGRRDHYAKLYYEALAELESYKRRIDFIVNDLEELGLTRVDPVYCTVLKNGFKEQVVGVCDGYTHLPMQRAPDNHSIPLYRTSHLSTTRSSARNCHRCHLPGHQIDILQASQSAPLLPQHPPGVHLPSSRAPKPAQLHGILMQKCPSMPMPSQPWPHAERPIPRRPPVPIPESCACTSCLSQKHLHSNRLRPQRSLDSACFCNGSDDSSSPICDEGHSAFELLDPPSPYKALRQNSGRTKPADPMAPVGHSRTSVTHSRRGTAPSQMLKSTTSSTRRACSDSDISNKRDIEEQQQVDVDSTASLYQKLSLRELNELSQFLGTPECDLSTLGVSDSQLCQANMMEALCTGLKNNSSIKELSLPHNGLGRRSLEILFGLLLKTPTSIRTLRLCSNNIGAECFQVLKDFLMDTDLQLLDLRSNDIAHNIPRCKQLEEVRGNCKLLFQAS